jgi:hypothetical protein
MFDDMVIRNLAKDGTDLSVLAPLLTSLQDHGPIRVATMCSGTESPLLAMDMIQQSLRKLLRRISSDEKGRSQLKKSGLVSDMAQPLAVTHVFSCEIEPFKQAYIERNFHPPIIFHDIRELCYDEATTAYGRLSKVPNQPGCVDLLIAGTSCVDYSNLNNQKVRCRLVPLALTNTNVLRHVGLGKESATADGNH